MANRLPRRHREEHEESWFLTVLSLRATAVRYRLTWTIRSTANAVRSAARLAQGTMSVVALALVAGMSMWLVHRMLPEQAPISESIDSGIALLTTLVGFLGVATLAVSVSTGLVGAVMERYSTQVVRPLIQDRDRDFLLGLILFTFVLTLTALGLLIGRLIRVSVALIPPMVLSVAVFAVLVGYVRQRLSLYDSRALVRMLARSVEELLQKPEREAVPSASRTAIGDLFSIALEDVKDGRLDDALEAADTVLQTLHRHAAERPSARHSDRVAYQVAGTHLVKLGQAIQLQDPDTQRTFLRRLDGWAGNAVSLQRGWFIDWWLDTLGDLSLAGLDGYQTAVGMMAAAGQSAKPLRLKISQTAFRLRETASSTCKAEGDALAVSYLRGNEDLLDELKGMVPAEIWTSPT